MLVLFDYIGAKKLVHLDQNPDGTIIDNPKTLPGKFIKLAASKVGPDVDPKDQEKALAKAWIARGKTINPGVERALEVLAANHQDRGMTPEIFQRTVASLVSSSGRSDKTFELVYQRVVEESNKDKVTAEMDVWYQVWKWGGFADKEGPQAEAIRKVFGPTYRSTLGWKEGRDPGAPGGVTYGEFREVLGPDASTIAPRPVVEAYAKMLGG